MKNYTEEEIKDRIKDLINEIDHDYNKYGDLSDWVRKDLRKDLSWIKNRISETRIITSSEITAFKLDLNKKRKKKRKHG